MALRTTATATNCVVDQALSVTYAKMRIPGSWSYPGAPGSTITFDHAWEYTRRATLAKRFVGMTKAAAEAAAASFRNSYTRDVKVSVYDGETVDVTGTAERFSDENGGTILMTDIAVVHDEGDAYTVVIQVSETDLKMRRKSHTASTLFTTENSRTYDFTYTGS